MGKHDKLTWTGLDDVPDGVMRKFDGGESVREQIEAGLRDAVGKELYQWLCKSTEE